MGSNQVLFWKRGGKWLSELQTALKPLVRAGKLLIWDDTKLVAGDEWRSRIDEALSSCSAAVLLVTRDFLASDFIANNELPPILEAAHTRGLRILWIAVSASGYTHTPIRLYQALNDPGRPLDTIPKPQRAKALVEIATRILEQSARIGIPAYLGDPTHTSANSATTTALRAADIIGSFPTPGYPLTPQALVAVERAVQVAEDWNDTYLAVPHLQAGLGLVENGVLQTFLSEHGITSTLWIAAIHPTIRHVTKSDALSNTTPKPTEAWINVFSRARNTTSTMPTGLLDECSLISAILEVRDKYVEDLLKGLGVDPKALRELARCKATPYSPTTNPLR